MRKVFGFFLAIMICFALVSCTGNEPEKNDGDTSESQSVSATDGDEENSAGGAENGGASGATGDGYTKNY